MTKPIHPMQPSNELMTDALTTYPDRHVLGNSVGGSVLLFVILLNADGHRP